MAPVNHFTGYVSTSTSTSGRLLGVAPHGRVTVPSFVLCGVDRGRTLPSSIVARASPNTPHHMPVPLTPAAGLPTYSLAISPNNVSTNIALSERHRMILSYFPTAFGVDDFIARIEVALCGYGFTGENAIAMTNLCRDEVTTVLKDKIEQVFGSSFNTNGLGAVLTCGVTGIHAGLSHAPRSKDGGRERYVFFSFPHIAINSAGAVGSIQRPGRLQDSCACGALAKALGQLKTEGVARSCKTPGVHDPLDPEFTILKQRLARRIRYDQMDIQRMNLCDLTKVAERTITDDLEYLIEKCVDPATADYAVVCGVQVHNWAEELCEGGEASLEFVAPTKVYVVSDGVKTHLELNQVPSLSPRQLMLLAEANAAGADSTNQIATAITYTGSRSSTLQEVALTYLTKRLGGHLMARRSNGGLGSGSFSSMSSMDEGAPTPKADHLTGPHPRRQLGPLQPPVPSSQAASSAGPSVPASGPANEWPSWQSKIRRGPKGTSTDGWMERDLNAPTMESAEGGGASGLGERDLDGKWLQPKTSFTSKGAVS